MPDNVLGDVLEELKDTVGSAAQQANPLDLVEAGVQQITGQQNMGRVDEKTHQKQMTSQIKQMKTIDEKNRKPIAIGSAMFSSKEITSMEKGKVIKNIHFVGDSFW